MKHREDGRIKLYVSQRLLCLRRELPGLFVGGSYTPLRGNQHVAAFVRGSDGQTLVIAAPVQIASLTRGALVAPTGTDVWRDSVLSVPGESGRTFRNLFTDQTVTSTGARGKAVLRLADVFADFPVAALVA
jgi:(1->4)-alpha-D-glucan 1-alpha-D-glucosylmutase